MRRYLDDEELVRQVGPEVAERIEAWLKRQPRAPKLVGATAAAELLAVKPPHITRLKAQGRMPEPLPVEGSVDVYIRSEVMALAKELKAERKRRATARAKREEAA